MYTLLYAEMNLFCTFLLILLFIRLKKLMLSSLYKKLFLRVLFFGILFFISDFLWEIVDGGKFGVPIFCNYLLAIIYFIFSCLVSYNWFLYSESVQKSVIVERRLYRMLFLIPTIVIGILAVISCWNGKFFFLDKNGFYKRGHLHFVHLLAFYGLIAFTAIKSFVKSFHSYDYREKEKLRALAYFSISPAVFGFIQFLCPGFPGICAGITFGLIYVFIIVQAQLVSIDPLTELNNRYQLVHYLNNKINSFNVNEKNLWLLMMDADYFKKINDTYGHLEGDHALSIIATSLKKACSRKDFFISRYGGDEFIVICELDKSEFIEDVCTSINAELDTAELPYKLSMSIGCALYSSGMNPENFIETADKELYRIKKEHHSVRGH